MRQPTFAEKARKRNISPLTTFNYPTEKQDLIFNHVEGKKIRNYNIIELHNLVGGTRYIIAASRVSGGIVIVFLAAKDIV